MMMNPLSTINQPEQPQGTLSQAALSQAAFSQAKLSRAKLQSRAKLPSQRLANAQLQVQTESHLASPAQTSKPNYLADVDISFASQLHNRVATQTSTNSPLSEFLRGIMECLFDGTMLISLTGELIYANSDAHHICNLLKVDTSVVPAQIWRSCEALIDSLKQYPDRTVDIEDELKIEERTIRVRVRQFEVGVRQTNRACLLVTLEDQGKSAQYRALAEARKYRLTGRETNVWELKRAGYTYKEIAAELYISEDTVKKHIKNIHVKRDVVDGNSDN